MIVYHGSDHIIEKPKYELGIVTNDFGKGFYMTEDEDLAKEYAVRFGKDGYLNEYDIDISNVKLLNLMGGKYNVLNWLALILKNRDMSMKSPIGVKAKQYIIDNFDVDTKGYDVIISYRAEDSYFDFIEKFLENTISLKELNHALKFGKLKTQFALTSKKAFECLTFQGSQVCFRKDCYPKKLNRDSQTRLAYDRFINKSFDVNDLYIVDILRGEMKNDDTRISRVLSE